MTDKDKKHKAGTKYWQEEGSLASRWLTPLEYRTMKRRRKQLDEDSRSVETWARAGFQSGVETDE